MCGIVGGFGLRCKKRDILSGHHLLSHRGQDESIFTECGPHGFWGMNRLSIQDPQIGLYPFHYKNYSLIFNGEIYNLPELIKLLLKKGYRCKSTCDAEVILPLFELYGSAAFAKIEGMFAIAIYDHKQECVYLARDLFGEKPLYYSQQNKAYFFASELQALPTLTHHVSSEAVPEFLTFGFLNDRRTFYQHVYKVMPGECVQLSDKVCVRTQFDQLSSYLKSDLANLALNEQASELENRLQKIVKKKLVGEAPIGIFLSGGVDSSLLTALVQAQNTQAAHTYSIGFVDQEHDESDVALVVAKHLQTKHTHVTFSDKKVKQVWETIIQSGDEPISDPAILPTALLAERAQQDVKVILAGEGADEIFGGYRRYQKLILAQKVSSASLAYFLKRNPLISWQMYKAIAPIETAYSPATYDILWRGSAKNGTQYLSWLAQVWQETSATESAFDSLSIPQYLQLHDLRHYVPEQLCMKIDKMLMLQTIESRAPYLDKSLLPFLTLSGREIAKHPFAQKNKTLLRKVAEQYLPIEIVNRPKHGFSIPLAHILKEVLHKEVSQLNHASPYLTEYLDQAVISKIVTDFQQGNDRLKNDLWNLVVLNCWLSGQG